MAKDFKAFVKRLSEDKNLAKKVSEARNEKEFFAIMEGEGVELTDADINNVSGGSLGSILDLNIKGDVTAKVNAAIWDISKNIATSTVYAAGDGSTAENHGNVIGRN